MKDIKKIQEFFSKPVKESLTGGFPYKKTSGEDFERIDIAEPMDNATRDRMIKNFRAAGWDAKPSNRGGIVAIKRAIMEAESEDPVDTITMDVPLFIRMLEYSREDAQEDMDLHDVAEKAISLNKEKDILSMEDYNEIVGGVEEINENKDIKVGDIVSKKFASTEEDYTKEFKVTGITGMKADLQDTKTGKNTKISLSDLSKVVPMKESKSDYMKRRKAQDDYAVNKKDKPKKSYNPTPSGKTDYMKRREKELAEAVLNKLKK